MSPMLTSTYNKIVAGAVAGALLLLTVTYLLLVQPRMAQAADLSDQARAAERSNQQLAVRIAELKSQAADLPNRRAELADIQRTMPSALSMAELVRSLDATAKATGVTLTAVTPGSSTSLADPTTTAAAAAAASGTPQVATSGSTSAGATAAAGAASSAALVTVTPVDLTLVGDYFAATQFVKTLQTGLARAVLVGGLDVTPKPGSVAGNPVAGAGDVTMVLHAKVFQLQLPSALTATTGADR